MTVENGKLPRHVAIIMDGNGRWAKKHMVKTLLGHHEGLDTMRAIIRECHRLDIPILTLFAFSSENWSRSADEISGIFSFITECIQKNLDEMMQKNAVLKILGDMSRLPKQQREELQLAQERSRSNTGMRLNFCINYGGRDELVRAAQRVAQRVERGELRAQDVDHAAFEAELYTAGMPDVDLLIRTSGEMRLSNFLLYQCAYAEMVFPSVLWPDFTNEEFHKALDSYAHRNRRYGGR